MAINYAKKYESKVDEAFKIASLSKSFTNNDYNWTGVDTIEVFSIPTVAMNDYALTGATRYGTAGELQNSVQTMLLTKDRSFTFTIDAKSNDDTNGVMDAGKAMRRQIDQVVTPEIDKYVFAKMGAAAVANSQTATAAITASNAYEKLLDANAVLDNALVPASGRKVAASSVFYKFIKLDPTFMLASDAAMGIKVNGQVGEVDGVAIVKVPAILLPTNCAFLLAHPIATVVANKLSSYITHVNPVGINGTVVEGRVRYDAFVLSNKVDAIFMHLTAAVSA